MNKYLDLTEILKDCPKGIKLYSPIFGDVYLDKIRPYLAIVVTTTKEQNSFKEEFLYDGRYGINGECMIFPSKDQRDWSKWHRPFVDGDIVTDIEGAIIIYKEITTSGYCGSFASLDHRNQFIPHYKAYLDYIRLSTDEEKEKLFQAIKDNGYNWNSKTKTLEELIVPKFKVGDKVRNKANGRMTGTIIALYEEVYEVKNSLGNEFSIDFINQDRFELVPKKFDPQTLQTFDKVLVRDSNNQKWMACLFSHIDNNVQHQFRTVDRAGWYHCIPFNDDTKHLVGKSEEALEFYRYWEE